MRNERGGNKERVKTTPLSFPSPACGRGCPSKARAGEGASYRTKQPSPGRSSRCSDRPPSPASGRGEEKKALIHLDAGLLDHRRPAREVALDLRLELGRRVADRLHQLHRELLLQVLGVDRLG